MAGSNRKGPHESPMGGGGPPPGGARAAPGAGDGPAADGYASFVMAVPGKGNVVFELPANYTCTEMLGSGSFGVVCKGTLRTDQGSRPVAIKRIATQAFHPKQDKHDYARKVVRELRLLRHFAGHENILGLIDIVRPRSATFGEVYIVTELLNTDLRHLMKDEPQYFEDPTSVMHFMYHLLDGLWSIHSADVMHRDLKPENILVHTDGSLRISDFGLARDDIDALHTAYVVTPWYRAPEVLLNERYNRVMDVFSAGCIFAELLGGGDSDGPRIRPALFPSREQSFNGTLEQITMILNFIGHTPGTDDQWIKSRNAQQWLRACPARPPADLRRPRGPFADPARVPDAALDLLKGMLTFNPNRRPSVQMCLQHPYFGEHAWEEVIEDEPWPKFDPFFERMLRPPKKGEDGAVLENARKLFNLEVSAFHPDFAFVPGVQLPEHADRLRCTAVPSGAADAHQYTAGMGEGWFASHGVLTIFSALEARRQAGACGPPEEEQLASAVASVTAGPPAEAQALAEALHQAGLTPGAGAQADPRLVAQVSPDGAHALALCFAQRLQALGHPAGPELLARVESWNTAQAEEEA
eukprot:TRINITY_DN19500_c0_g1_i2.p1 TRINITY_DN19500_c0_g1~~TRINITY_DN19500_c0_g1_i2.p1  ORF type:complete len:614 (+),score=167.77 TRINITY_DN19500_c0_g1_i2:95-1843(+)